MSTKKDVRNLLFTMKMNESEKNMIKKAADIRGLSSPKLIRTLVDDEASRLGFTTTSRDE